MTVEEWESAMQRACEQRTVEMQDVLFDDSSGDGLSGLYCGCVTCDVREILDAAWPFMYRLAHHPDTEEPALP